MNKELTPLEALNKVVYCYGYDKNVEIVSKALQENVVLNLANIELEHHLKLAEKELKENEPKLKALEIIKEKQVQVADLLDCIANEKADYVESGLVEYNGWHFEYRQLTQEEYDLLKEVLL